VAFVDELPFAVGWLEEDGLMQRAAHAFAVDDRVYVVDPFDHPGAEERVAALGEPAAVVQLLDRHARDCAAWAERLGVPHHVVPRDGLPFELIPVPAMPGWREVAAYLPEQRTLVVAEALVTAPGYLVRGERVAVHPFLPLRPPRVLRGRPVDHLLVGHGVGLHGESVAEEIDRATSSRSVTRVPAFALASARRLVRRR
jgi:hypothetical protein